MSPQRSWTSFSSGIVSKPELTARKAFISGRVGSQVPCVFRYGSELKWRGKILSEEHRTTKSREADRTTHMRNKAPSSFLEAEEYLKYDCFPTRIFFPLQLTLKWLQSTCRMNYSIGEKCEPRGVVERREERKTVLCRCKAVFIQNNKVNERTLPSLYGPLADTLWQLLLTRVVWLGMAESCLLKARLHGEFSKLKWGFKPIQFNWHKSCLDAFTSDAWGEHVFLATWPYSSYFRPGWAEKFQSYWISREETISSLLPLPFYQLFPESCT